MLATMTKANSSTVGTYFPVRVPIQPEAAAAPGSRTRRPDGLTDREAEVLRLPTFGHTNLEIAAKLVSASTPSNGTCPPAHGSSSQVHPVRVSCGRIGPSEPGSHHRPVAVRDPRYDLTNHSNYAMPRSQPTARSMNVPWVRIPLPSRGGTFARGGTFECIASLRPA
jgi:hypothetical protein